MAAPLAIIFIECLKMAKIPNYLNAAVITWVQVFCLETDFRLCLSGCSCDSCRSALKNGGGGRADRPRLYRIVVCGFNKFMFQRNGAA